MLYPARTSTKVLIVVVVLAALAALFYWWSRANPTASNPATSAPGAIAPGATAPRATDKLPPSPPGVHWAPVPSAAPEQPPPVQANEAPPATAEALERIRATLLGLARACGAAAPSNASPSSHARLRVTTAGDHVEVVDAVAGDLPQAVSDCLDERWRQARWGVEETDPKALTLELELSLADLR